MFGVCSLIENTSLTVGGVGKIIRKRSGVDSVQFDCKQVVYRICYFTIFAFMYTRTVCQHVCKKCLAWKVVGGVY